MCGIAGMLSCAGPVDPDVLERMGEALHHRGPDGAGSWTDADAGIGLAHRRLSVLDLSPAGTQPMCSHDGRWWISFNGEIYNHDALRRELGAARSIPWRGHSDTEVLLACLSHWGVDETLARVNGMFALALWDRHERQLYLARDPVGEKPLYIGWFGGGIAFASELRAFLQLPGFKTDIDRDALGALLRHGYIPAPDAIYEGVYKLPQGSYIVLDRAFASRVPDTDEFLAMSRRYWRLSDVAGQGLREQYPPDVRQTKQLIDRQLRRSIALRMSADVPVGAFLSGGIDSSLIVALMQAQSTRPVRTFTIGFDASDQDESSHAEAVARHLGTEHLTVRFDEGAARDRVPGISALYDEPFADSSQLPTAMLAEVAREHVTVSLAGDGGDELYFGYARYFRAQALWSLYRHMPGIGHAAARLLRDSLGARFSRRGARFRRLLEYGACRDANEVHAALTDTRLMPEQLLVGLPTVRRDGCTWSVPPMSAHRDELQMMFCDQQGYLPDNLMVKTDRASMAVALEVRMPFLDPGMVASSWRVPFSLKSHAGVGKWLLREMLADYVPRALFDRPKQGFSVPLGGWLRGPLREWAEDLLAERRLRADGYLQPRPVREIWNRHLQGHDQSRALWAILAFQSWLAHQPPSQP